MKYTKIILAILILIVVSGCQRQSGDVIEAVPDDIDFAQGVIRYPVKLNNVWAQVNDVRAFSAEASGNQGFAYIVLNLSMVNDSTNPIVPSTITLVDRFGNAYISRQDGDAPATVELQPMPLAINRGDSVTGTQVYLVPLSALQSDLRMRWQSSAHNSRIDLLLGQLTLAE